MIYNDRVLICLQFCPLFFCYYVFEEYGDLHIGQNYALGYPTWKAAIKAWFNEVELYKYGEDPDIYLGPDEWPKIAHYTQVIITFNHILNHNLVENQLRNHSTSLYAVFCRNY